MAQQPGHKNKFEQWYESVFAAADKRGLTPFDVVGIAFVIISIILFLLHEIWIASAVCAGFCFIAPRMKK